MNGTSTLYAEPTALSPPPLLRNTGERILIKIATVAERLPREFKDAHPDVDWVAISRMRKLVAHHDDTINDDLMWSALAVRVQSMAEALRKEPLQA